MQRRSVVCSGCCCNGPCASGSSASRERGCSPGEPPFVRLSSFPPSRPTAVWLGTYWPLSIFPYLPKVERYLNTRVTLSETMKHACQNFLSCRSSFVFLAFLLQWMADFGGEREGCIGGVEQRWLARFGCQKVQDAHQRNEPQGPNNGGL